MGHGGTLTPITTSPPVTGIITGIITTGLAPLPLTLTMFSQIMNYPACQFMGVRTSYDCKPIDCGQRNRIVAAAMTASGLIESRLNMRGYSLYERNETLQSNAGYFRLGEYEVKELTCTTYDASVETPRVIECGAQVTIDVQINAPDPDLCEEIYSVRVYVPDQICKRLAIQPVSVSANVAQDALQIVVDLADLIDIDSFDGTVPEDAIPLVSAVKVEVCTVKPSVPHVLWNPLTCTCLSSEDSDDCTDPCCRYTQTDACLIEREHGIYDVIDYAYPCSNATVRRYEVDVIHNGLWVDAWADALISLMNTRIPSDFCGCDTLVNERFRDDNGLSTRYEKVYPYSFNNPFGILAPGAQYAWRTIESAMSNTVVIKA